MSMPRRIFSESRWAREGDLPKHRVVAFRIPKRRRARNVQTLRDCPVCGLHSSPRAHDTLVCGAKHGLRGHDVALLERRGAGG